MDKRRINIIGHKFSRLTVIDFFHTDKNTSACWLCKCDCGNETIVRGANLRNGHTKSCGCLGKEQARENVKKRRTLPEGVAVRNNVLYIHKKNAKNRNLEQALTDEQILALHKQNCHYCGSPPSNTYSRPDCNGAYTYNGIDRVDNDKGYTMDNVVPCCGFCNRAKQDSSVEEFMRWIDNFINYRTDNQ